MQVLDEQEAINAKIARQAPVIAQKSTQEQPKKSKRKGFLGLFGKKEEPKPTVTTTMLYTLNRDIITRQQAQNKRLAEYTDSLVVRNGELNRQLQSLIRKMDDRVQSDLQQREDEIDAMREHSFLQIGGLTGFVLLLLVISYIIIHRDANRIKRYKEKTARLISELQESAARNEELITLAQESDVHHHTRTAHAPYGNTWLCRTYPQRKGHGENRQLFRQHPHGGTADDSDAQLVTPLFSSGQRKGAS